MSISRTRSSSEARQRCARMRQRVVWTARRTVGASINTLSLLCARWGDTTSRRAVQAFERSLKSKRPRPERWGLDQILAALTSGASDVDAGARRLAADLRALVSELEDLAALERELGRLAR